MVTPGERLGDAAELVAGAGTYELQDAIFAAVAGVKRVRPAAARAEKARGCGSGALETDGQTDMPVDADTNALCARAAATRACAAR